MHGDDPPHLNCRAVYVTRRRTISLIPITLIDVGGWRIDGALDRKSHQQENPSARIDRLSVAPLSTLL
jgi:hypothetical protein